MSFRFSVTGAPRYVCSRLGNVLLVLLQVCTPYISWRAWRMPLLVSGPSSASSCCRSSSKTDRRLLRPLLRLHNDTGILLFFRVRKRGAVRPWS